jgi:uncharacterized protein (TIGR02145 family)
MKRISSLLASIFFSYITLAQTVTIGTQVWTTKNLDVSTFRNGDPIPEAKTDEEWKKAGENQQPAWCYYDNNSKNSEIFGKLYNWYAVNDSRGLAPKGWHIPSDEEWTILTDYLGGEDIAGNKMKSQSGWKNNGNGSNLSGFEGLPGGGRYFINDFGSIGLLGCWWTSTESNAKFARYREIYFSNGSVDKDGFSKINGFSVRCIKN